MSLIYPTSSLAKERYIIGYKSQMRSSNNPQITVKKLSKPELQSVKQDQNVSYVTLDKPYKLLDLPMDSQTPGLEDYWHFKPVGIFNTFVEDPIFAEQSPVIAIVDSGINPNHRELKGRVIAGSNIINPRLSYKDDNGHGTHIAAIAAGSLNNNFGGFGMSPNARLLAVKVMDKKGEGWTSDVIKGIYWAVKNDADVINLSLGGTEFDRPLADAIKYAHQKNVLVVCAAGNEQASQIIFPARLKTCLSVGASDRDNLKAEYSNYGPGLDLMAPGDEIYSAGLKNNALSYESGTSMAAPIVAGIAGNLIAKGHTAASVRAALINTALDMNEPGWDRYTGFGLVQADLANRYLANPQMIGKWGKCNAYKQVISITTQSANIAAKCNTFTNEVLPSVQFEPFYFGDLIYNETNQTFHWENPAIDENFSGDLTTTIASPDLFTTRAQVTLQVKKLHTKIRNQLMNKKRVLRCGKTIKHACLISKSNPNNNSLFAQGVVQSFGKKLDKQEVYFFFASFEDLTNNYELYPKLINNRYKTRIRANELALGIYEVSVEYADSIIFSESQTKFYLKVVK